MAKLHFKYFFQEEADEAPEMRIACGVHKSEALHTTKSKDFVTCNNCLRIMENKPITNLKK